MVNSMVQELIIQAKVKLRMANGKMVREADGLVVKVMIRMMTQTDILDQLVIRLIDIASANIIYLKFNFDLIQLKKLP
jgi:hypothetical protein